ncbi:MAG: DUF4159 domain-containing protein [Lentisphaerae bacterium]|nr:DUF4159 domain-containing protein [Lentisphaerota bacterium]
MLNVDAIIERMERSGRSRTLPGRLVIGLLKSRYFFCSAAAYILILLLVGKIGISTYEKIKGTFEGSEVLIISPPEFPAQPPPQQKTDVVKKTDPVVKTLADPADDARRIALDGLSPSKYVMPPTIAEAPLMSDPDIKEPTTFTSAIIEWDIARIKKAEEFQRPWRRTGVRDQTRAKFTIYKAKYQGSIGPQGQQDWNCNPSDMANLMRQIKLWSKGRIDANLYPEVLDVGTDKLFEVRPPFVYLTGHMDFKFLDQEVANLRDYLLLSGCVWADSALAGRRSRFDIAFRREMKRVLPDRDWEVVPRDHEIFTYSFFDKLGLPSGMNYYEQPPEMINIGGELAVLYTMNGYGHFWEARLDEAGKIERRQIKVAPRQWAYVYGPHFAHNYASVLYRNYDDATVKDSYKFGLNVVVHLLTRYEDKFRFLPRELPTGPQAKASSFESIKFSL